MKYTGSCHCGNAKFTAEGEIDQVIECNCSHCGRKGFLLWFIPIDKFKLETPKTALTEYTFNTHKIKHQFCPICGVEAFAYGKDPASGADTAAINVRCLEDIDLSTLKRYQYDGKHS